MPLSLALEKQLGFSIVCFQMALWLPWQRSIHFSLLFQMFTTSEINNSNHNGMQCTIGCVYIFQLMSPIVNKVRSETDSYETIARLSTLHCQLPIYYVICCVCYLHFVFICHARRRQLQEAKKYNYIAGSQSGKRIS